MKDVGLFRFLFPRGKEHPRKSDIFVRRPCEILGDGGVRHPILIAHLRVVRAEGAKREQLRFQNFAAEFFHLTPPKQKARG